MYQHLGRRGRNGAAALIQGLSADLAVDIDLTRGLEHHFSAVHRDSIGPNLAAVLEGAGKNTHRVAAERAQVERLVSGGLQLKADAL